MQRGTEDSARVGRLSSVFRKDFLDMTNYSAEMIAWVLGIRGLELLLWKFYILGERDVP